MPHTLDQQEESQGSWMTYPPLRNALLAGILSLIVFLLEKAGIISAPIATGFFLIAIFVGGYLWVVEGVKELLSEREVGISILMIAATMGAGYLGMWDEAAALVVLYGAAEGIACQISDIVSRG